MNILFFPLAVGMGAYFICALVDVSGNKATIKCLNTIFSKSWIIAASVVVTAISWCYNIIRWI